MSNNHIIKNFANLANTKEREVALEIIEAGLLAINTSEVIQKHFLVEGNILKIKNQTFDLRDFKNIYLVGFGKCALDATLAIEKKIGNLIKFGVIIDIKNGATKNPAIKVFTGSHPKPTIDNIKATQNVIELSKLVTSEDLILIIVSGGGSALLCASENECDANGKIYDEFLKAGGTINELNILRKHVSDLKGGGLSKLFYPATLVSLIFSDIPSGDIAEVASGPTFKDRTTLEDVKKILDKYNLDNLRKEIKFIETPKEDKYFEKNIYILMLSNVDAVNAMSDKAINLKFKPRIISTNISYNIESVARIFNENLNNNEVMIGAGEPKISIPQNIKVGIGGRNCHLALEAAQYIKNNSVFISLASDGIDNSDAAGAIVDATSFKKISEKFDYQKEKNSFNSYSVFKEINGLIFTGPTGTNVSDIMMSIKY